MRGIISVVNGLKYNTPVGGVMHLLVGLGNPGVSYAQTRHNAGFLFADYWAQQVLQATEKNVRNNDLFSEEKRFFSHAVKTKNWTILKPQTFMNDSGRAVRAVTHFFRYDVLGENASDPLIVCHDDLDLAVGTWKLQFGRGPKIHNGLRSIDAELGSDQYWHLRLGVDGRNGDRSLAGQDYVLQSFSPQERALFA
jgi:PTH1 family peptidyl-tRNA hydrolase